MGFSRQEFRNGFLFPSPRDLPYSGIEPGSLRPPALADIFFTTSTNKPMHFLKTLCSRVYVRETSKSKSRKKRKKKRKKKAREREGGGCQEEGKGKKKIKKEHLPVQITSSIPGASDSKKSTCDAVDPGLIPGYGRFVGERNGNPLLYSCLQNYMDRGDWWATVHGVAKGGHDWTTNTYLEHLSPPLRTFHPPPWCILPQFLLRGPELLQYFWNAFEPAMAHQCLVLRIINAMNLPQKAYIMFYSYIILHQPLQQHSVLKMT